MIARNSKKKNSKTFDNKSKPVKRELAGEVRIIGGKWKRTKLPVSDLPGLRPTPDRIRETLFNWLGQDLHGWKCLDAFAGTGALGFEAASRGATVVTLVEKNRRLVQQLRDLQEKLQANEVNIVGGDALAVLKRCEARSMDLIFIDPPYTADLFDEALLLAQRVLAPGGAIYLEANHPIEPPEGLIVYKQAQAGAVCYYLFTHASENVF